VAFQGIKNIAQNLRARRYKSSDRLASIAGPGARVLSTSALDQLIELIDLARWRLNWDQYDLDDCPADLPEKFVSARQALTLINAEDTVLSSGFGVTGRCSLFFWGVRDLYRETAYPHSLRWMSVSAQGGRGMLPGTVEELAEPGLLSSYFCGHMESAGNLLALAQQGKLELQSLPQGVMAQLIELQAQGIFSLKSTVGLGCFFDPRVGPGSAVTVSDQQWVKAAGEELEYSLPKIDVALISASYADKRGNIYFTDLPTISEHREAAQAAHANGGKVLVTVGAVVDPDKQAVAIPSEWVDAVVVNPLQEQFAGVRLDDAWPIFLPEAEREAIDTDPQTDMSRLRLLNSLATLANPRGEPDKLMASHGAELVLRHTASGGLANVGVGMPEEVAYQVQLDPRGKELIFTSEAGVYGGLPGSGLFFGMAVQPQSIHSSAWMFKRYAQGLDITVLGFLQVDSQGNVNVSHRGDQPKDFVGAGGFCDIAEAAWTIVFVGSWMVRGQYRIKNGCVKMIKPGRAKFVKQVKQICFNGQRAIAQGKDVYYVSNVGVFKLSSKGIQLEYLMPGIDLQKDVLDISEAEILLPRN
jgi:propionate CoA-transferase